jgi:hypothetical protein
MSMVLKLLLGRWYVGHYDKGYIYSGSHFVMNDGDKYLYIYLLVASCQMRIISHRNLQLSSSILMLNKLKFWLSSSIHTIRGLDWDLYWHIKLYWHTFIKKNAYQLIIYEIWWRTVTEEVFLLIMIETWESS